MDLKIIEDALRDYKRKKSVIDTTRERIKVFQNALEHPEDHWGIFLGSSWAIGIPRGEGYGGTSAVEFSVLTEEEERELLKQWISDEQSRIYPLEVEVRQIEGALSALTKQQRFIIECKYFEEMFWRDIEISFNNTFRQQNYITYEGLKKINKEAVEVLAGILEPYYMRFKTT